MCKQVHQLHVNSHGQYVLLNHVQMASYINTLQQPCVLTVQHSSTKTG
jgi:hypothetical protein